MPKSRPMSGPTSDAVPKPAVPPESGEKHVAPVKRRRGVDAVLDFHRLGLKVLARQKADGGSRQRAAKQIAQDHGENFETAKKAADFANEYPDGVPDWLRTLFEPPEGRPIGVLHVRRVLGVKTEDQRAWLERACKGGWSALRLTREIRKATGVGTVKGGKPFQPTADLDETLDDIMTRGGEWLRRYQPLLESKASQAPWQPREGLGPEDIAAMRKRMKEARELLKRLAVGAERLQDQLGNAGRRLGPGTKPTGQDGR